jgi:cytochrome P450
LIRIRQEIDNVLGSRSTVQFDDLSGFEYTSCAIKETLRKYPPAAAISRQTPEDTVICGYKIPKHTWIQVRFWLIR